MRLTVLAGTGRSTNILLNWLYDQEFHDVEAIIENSVPRRILLRNRRRKLGLWTTMGQVAFQALVPSVLRRLAGRRTHEILSEHGLRDDVPTGVRIRRVESVNDERTLELLRRRKPDLVLVNGTRIICGRVLGSLECPIVNTHVGITPWYRGVHGGYWSLWSGDHENFGVTIHFVDEGVDTGGVIAQVHVEPTRRDNFSTYPLLQQAVSLPALKSFLSDGSALSGNRVRAAAQNTEAGRQWYHPTLWQYISGLLRGVK